MTYQLVLYVAGMAWGVLFGLWLAWIWRHQRRWGDREIGRWGDGETRRWGDVEEQRQNRAELAAQPGNLAQITKAWLRLLKQQDQSAMFIIMGFGNSQTDICQPPKIRREQR